MAAVRRQRAAPACPPMETPEPRRVKAQLDQAPAADLQILAAELLIQAVVSRAWQAMAHRTVVPTGRSMDAVVRSLVGNLVAAVRRVLDREYLHPRDRVPATMVRRGLQSQFLVLVRPIRPFPDEKCSILGHVLAAGW